MQIRAYISTYASNIQKYSSNVQIDTYTPAYTPAYPPAKKVYKHNEYY